jgi:hypothetical protein
MAYEIADVYKLVRFMEADNGTGFSEDSEIVNARPMLGVVDTTVGVLVEKFAPDAIPDHWREHFNLTPSGPNMTFRVPKEITEKIRCSLYFS